MDDTWFKVVVSLVAAAVVWMLFRLRSQVKEVHQIMNSRLDSLLSVSNKKERAEGVLEGKAQGLAEREKKTTGTE